MRVWTTILDLPLHVHLILSALLFFFGLILVGLVSPWFFLLWLPAALHAGCAVYQVTRKAEAADEEAV